jgi:tetratricopeptide (TPR) repeat protein
MLATALAAFLTADLLSASSGAFANVAEGDPVPEATLPTLDGKKEPLLGKTDVSVFLFFRTGQEHSRATLEALAAAQKELAGKPVRWTAVISDRFAAAEVAAEVKASGFAGPVLVDAGDALYGTMGVAMHPCIGIAGKDHKLLFYQAFTKINYADVIRARVRFALGEISREEMQKVVEPPAATQGGEAQMVRRFFKLGERLYQAKDYAKALDSAKKCLEHDANAANCLGLRAAALAAQGNCAEARKSAEKSLAADPKDALAAEAKAACP